MVSATLDRHTRSCWRKVKFRSLKQARKAFYRMDQSRAKGLVPYVCTACGAWHLGHTPKKTLRALRTISAEINHGQSQPAAENARETREGHAYRVGAS